ncbi:transposable element Tcb2 transposase [Trichonephila clavipes]|nr:transposable element Tcb2 transposase [Trichonephila clavipes]
MWNVTDWQKVVFSDESRFVLGTDDNRVRVWRRPGALFQQDNARPHTAGVSQDFLRQFETLPWPACSPDLSPVEHAWDQLKRQMPSSHSVHDLELAVQDLWAHLPQDNIRSVKPLSSMKSDSRSGQSWLFSQSSPRHSAKCADGEACSSQHLEQIGNLLLPPYKDERMSECLLMSHYTATQELLATGLVILEPQSTDENDT